MVQKMQSQNEFYANPDFPARLQEIKKGANIIRWYSNFNNLLLLTIAPAITTGPGYFAPFHMWIMQLFKVIV